MKPCVLLLLAALSTVAQADASLGERARVADAASLRCDARSWEAGPFVQALRDPQVKALESRYEADLIAVGVRHLLLRNDYFNDLRPALVIERSSGRQLGAVPGDVSGLVEDEAGALVGVLVANVGARTLTLIDGRPGHVGERRWVAPDPGLARGEEASGLVRGELLLLAHFRYRSSGAGLVALDVRTGERRWVADAVELQLKHRKYWNGVTLALDGDSVIMTGLESGGCTRQRFALTSGRRLASELKPLW
jgi:hypothetical protein